jgi:hypothetical protein
MTIKPSWISDLLRDDPPLLKDIFSRWESQNIYSTAAAIGRVFRNVECRSSLKPSHDVIMTEAIKTIQEDVTRYGVIYYLLAGAIGRCNSLYHNMLELKSNLFSLTPTGRKNSLLPLAESRVDLECINLFILILTEGNLIEPLEIKIDELHVTLEEIDLIGNELLPYIEPSGLVSLIIQREREVNSAFWWALKSEGVRVLEDF